jgi:hypothetical protein
MEHLPEWSAVVISVVALLISVLESRASRKRLERRDSQLLLDNFLLPLRTIMNRTAAGFENLTRGHANEVHRLEYFPGHLRNVFENLPDERKLFWQFEIEQLQKDDLEAVQLIDQYASRALVDPAFQEACASLRKHVVDWKGKWDYILRSKQSQELPESNSLLADPFPAGFDQALEREIKRIQGLAEK